LIYQTKQKQMEASIKGRAIIIVMMFFILLTGICSAVQAQTVMAYSEDHPISQVKTAGKEIRHANGVNLTAKATPLKIGINSPYMELKPALTPNGNRLYFSRHAHPDNTFGVKDMEDIWFSDFDPTNNTWSDPALMTGHLNNAGPNYINSVSVSGDTVILGNKYLKNGKMRAGVSYSVNYKGEWSEPKTIDIKDDYNISGASNTFVSIKTGVIIRAVQRAETYGERDLYVSFWNGTEATMPVNMGSVINTEMEESSPFMDPDGKTLYFASKGHNGYGGSDIWVTQRLDDSWTNWSEPRNLGPAVNGQMDEEFFSITHCGSYAIFSKQVSVHNVDLFRISVEELFSEPVKKEFQQNGIEGNRVALASL
jgi:OOP family OmpA-OmpF porin